VLDSGVGIAPEQLAAIFQPFEQVGELSRRAGGTGLGLAISRQLVQMMGSDIQVESRPGHGSRFWFELRLPVPEAPAPAQAQRRISGYDGRRRSILVVDDEPTNRELMLEWLDTLGFRVQEAEHGAAALRQAEAEVPDLILMDMAMPVMNGLEATRRARALPALQAVPIIIASASAGQDDQEQALAAGANAFITKPIHQQELTRQLGALLRLDWRDAPPQAEPAATPAAPLQPPPAEALAALHRLALAGNMRELREQAGRLAVEHPGCQAFAAQLAQLTTELKSKAVLKLIEAHL